MLKTQLLHPGILAGLAACGHGSQVLITDGNFPHGTAPYPGAPRVFLNLSPDRLTVSDVLEALVTTIAIERAAFMDPQDDGDARPVAHELIQPLLPHGTQVDHFRRHDFYAATTTTALGLVIATADTRPYANVLLTIGVVASD